MVYNKKIPKNGITRPGSRQKSDAVVFNLFLATAMRFGVKPERPGFLDRSRARYNTYKVPSDSEDSSSDEFEEAVVESSDSDDSFCYASESEIPAKLG